MTNSLGVLHYVSAVRAAFLRKIMFFRYLLYNLFHTKVINVLTQRLMTSMLGSSVLYRISLFFNVLSCKKGGIKCFALRILIISCNISSPPNFLLLLLFFHRTMPVNIDKWRDQFDVKSSRKAIKIIFFISANKQWKRRGASVEGRAICEWQREYRGTLCRMWSNSVST